MTRLKTRNDARSRVESMKCIGSERHGRRINRRCTQKELADRTRDIMRIKVCFLFVDSSSSIMVHWPRTLQLRLHFLRARPLSKVASRKYFTCSQRQRRVSSASAFCSMDLKHKWKSHSIVSTAIIDSVAVEYTHTAPTQCRYIRIPIDRMSSWAHISTFGYHQHQRKHTWYKESTNRKHTSSTNGVRKWDIDFIRCFFIISMLEKWFHSGNKNATKTHI